MGPSIFPITGLGIRAYVGNEEWSAQVAVLDGKPGDQNDVRKTSLKINRRDGALIAAEAGRAGETESGGA